MARPERQFAGRMPPPKRGRPYYDVDRGQQMILPPGGGKAIPYVGGDGPAKFDPGKALRRSGVQSRSLGRELADDAGNAAAALAERQPFNVGAFGGFLVTAAAALLGLIVLDILLRRPAAIEKTLGGLSRGVSILVDPRNPIFETVPTGTAAPATGAAPASSSAPAPERRGLGGLFFPVGGKASFSNDFNAPRADTGSHGGIDIFAKQGTEVIAFEGGTLDRVGWNTLGGNRLWVMGDHDAYYAHLSEYAPGIREGARVEAGQVLGYVGTTGNARGTPPHLHFELHKLGQRLNPFALLDRLFNAKSTTAPEGVVLV